MEMVLASCQREDSAFMKLRVDLLILAKTANFIDGRVHG
jgi:hypothetical protein